MNMRSTGDVPMHDPVAFFLTWPTYGTWLPGDQRVWTEYYQGWQLPSPNLERLCKTRMTEQQCLLSGDERDVVMDQIHKTCNHRGWTLYAVDCRSNHAHAVSVYTTRIQKRVDWTSKPGVLDA